MIAVQLSVDSKLRDSVGLLSNPSLLEKEVIINGRLGNYFNVKGIKKVSSIELVESGEIINSEF